MIVLPLILISVVANTGTVDTTSVVSLGEAANFTDVNRYISIVVLVVAVASVRHPSCCS